MTVVIAVAMVVATEPKEGSAGQVVTHGDNDEVALMIITTMTALSSGGD